MQTLQKKPYYNTKSERVLQKKKLHFFNAHSKGAKKC